MAELLLNVEAAVVPEGRPGRRGCCCSEGNAKHRRFVRRRRLLERRGLLRQKQPPPAPDSARGSCRRRRRSEGGPRSRAREKTPGPPPPEPPPGASERPARARRWGECARGLSASRGPGRPGSKLVALDCEMVGTGPGGRNSDLARCSIVGYHGDVLYDEYVRPAEPITNFRTRWSGVRRHHMARALPFKAAQKEILKILSGKIVIGHAIHNDFKALKYFHPKSATRDTSKIPLLNRKAGFPENESASLKRLTKQLLHRDIQVGQNGHSSVEDARATMELYKMVEADWERHLASCPEQD